MGRSDGMENTPDSKLEGVNRAGKADKDAKEKTVNIKTDGNRESQIKELLNNYEKECNKVITDWTQFKKEDIQRELGFCIDAFMLMKVGDRIKCDCGNKEIPLELEGKAVVSKGGTTGVAGNNIPKQIKDNEKGCFGTCLLEEPSMHPGMNPTGGNPCEPHIVGTSWLETYNDAKAEDIGMVLSDKSWLACRYMGRIMDADLIPEFDLTIMTEKDAFEWMLKWIKGEEHIPQVVLDKITHIYAGGDDAVDEFRREFAYNNPGNKAEYDYKNIDKFDSKFLAWSKFVNNLWDDNDVTHLKVRPVVLKAMSILETTLGEKELYNGHVNIMHSMTIGDGTFWHIANYYPYSKTFTYDSEDNILVWLNKEDNNKQPEEAKGDTEGENKDSNGEEAAGWIQITNGYVEFGKSDAFTDKGERRVSGEERQFFGKSHVGDKVGNPVFRESIKTISTHSQYPANEGEMIMVVYGQQSLDMSLYAAGVALANKSTTEKEAVGEYNVVNKQGYIREMEKQLAHMGTKFKN